MRRSRWLAGVVVSLTALALGACSGGPNGVDACRQIESARCVQAGNLNCVDLSYPLHSGSAVSDGVTACQLFYEDACLHGLVTPKAPASTQVTLCVKAITAARTCEVGLTPQSDPACSWLIAPDAGVDAGHDATSADVVTTTTVTTTVGGMDAGIDQFVSTCDTTCESTCVNNPACITACGC